MAEPISVSALNQYIKGIMDRDRVLSQVLVRGEISNYKAYPSGHHYFSLKDAEGSLRCVMFRREASSLRFRPERGMTVIAAGRITVFPRDGQYQLYCTGLTPDGIGDLHLAFEQCKERLHKEGLFDECHKKPLPGYPQTIALITSPAGAAVRDMLRVLQSRYPLAAVQIVPVRVQGAEAPGEIAAALDLVNLLGEADLIIAGRGGGSLEDLWAFNEEIVARAIFRSQIPVISAVGHEPDVTIADFVADLRAATPSNAAELSVPDRVELKKRLSHMEIHMASGLGQKLHQGRRVLERARTSSWLKAPFPLVEQSKQLLDYQQEKLVYGLEKTMQQQKKRMGQMAAALDALSPLKVLGRGYSLLQDEKRAPITSIKQVKLGEKIHVQMADGSLNCLVEGKEQMKK